MGGCTSKSPGATEKPLCILVVGLDGAGKSTLVHAINGELDYESVPTIGLSKPVTRKVEGSLLKFFDLGGGNRIRAVWKNFYPDVFGTIFVVDSADPGRLEECKRELTNTVEHEMIRGKPLLILANKQDEPTHLSEVDVSLGMGLDSLPMTRHKIVPCVAKPQNFGGVVDDRIWEGLRWLVSVIKTDYNILEARVAQEQETFKQQEAARKAAKAKALAEGRPAGAKPKPAVPMCTVCKSVPAARRCAAAKWEAVCNPCGDRLEAAAAGGANPDAASGSGAGAPAGSAAADTAAAASGTATAKAADDGEPADIPAEDLVEERKAPQADASVETSGAAKPVSAPLPGAIGDDEPASHPAPPTDDDDTGAAP